MKNIQNYTVFVVHYTKLNKRKRYLATFFEKNSIHVEWITEKIRPFKEKVKEALKSESVELAKSVIKDEVVDLINSKLTDVVKKFSGSIIEQLSGPTGWLKTAYEIFEKSSWVL